MCLYKTHWLPKFSRKPIIVYKEIVEIRSELFTPYQRKKVIIGKPIEARWHWIFEIFYLFSSTITGGGVHAYRNKPVHCNYYFDIYKAVIPPYTAYWIGNNGDIAANRLILQGKVCCNNWCF